MSLAPQPTMPLWLPAEHTLIQWRREFKPLQGHVASPYLRENQKESEERTTMRQRSMSIAAVPRVPLTARSRSKSIAQQPDKKQADEGTKRLGVCCAPCQFEFARELDLSALRE